MNFLEHLLNIHDVKEKKSKPLEELCWETKACEIWISNNVKLTARQSRKAKHELLDFIENKG